MELLYERKQACEYLECLQSRIMSHYGKKHTSQKTSDEIIYSFYKNAGGFTSDQTFDEFVKEYREMEKLDIEKCPSKFEDPSWFALIDGMTTKIKDYAQKAGIDIPNNFLFGTLHSQRVNGMAMQVPNNSFKLILIESGLFGFANLMAKILAQTFPLIKNSNGESTFSTDITECYKKIESNNEIIERFWDIIIAYIIKGDPHFAKPYVLNRDYTNFSGIFRNGIEYFVLAHEFGHIIGGHIDNSPSNMITIAETDYQILLSNWKDEFEADSIGLNLSLNIMHQEGYDFALSYCGADLFFGCIDVVENALDVLKYGEILEKVSKTHPPTLARRDNLRNLIIESFPNEDKESLLSLSYRIENIISKLWSIVEGPLKSLHKDGVKVSPIWG